MEGVAVAAGAGGNCIGVGRSSGGSIVGGTLGAGVSTCRRRLCGPGEIGRTGSINGMCGCKRGDCLGYGVSAGEAEGEADADGGADGASVAETVGAAVSAGVGLAEGRVDVAAALAVGDGVTLEAGEGETVAVGATVAAAFALALAVAVGVGLFFFVAVFLCVFRGVGLGP